MIRINNFTLIPISIKWLPVITVILPASGSGTCLLLLYHGNLCR
jgi:hypothetical protein